MSVKLTWDQAVAHMSGDEERLTQYLRGDTALSHPVFDMFLPVADGTMRSRITSRYTTMSYDAWDSSTIPPYVQFHLFSLLLGEATARDEQRPQLINDYAGIAVGWLDEIESGKARIPELAETSSSSSGATGGRTARVGPAGSRRSWLDEFRHRTHKL